MATVGDVIDRIFRSYLEPPNQQPAMTRLGASLTDSATSVTLSTFEVPEDEELLRQGTVLEIDSELVKVEAYTSPTATVRRGMLGTTATAHANGAYVKLAPPFPRIDVFNSVKENIVLLGSRLYTVRTVYMGLDHGGIAPVEASAVSPRWWQPESVPDTRITDCMIIDYHPQVGGRAFAVPGWVGGGYGTYRRRMLAPTSEADTLDELGVEDVWVPIIMVSVAADLLVGRDIPKSQTEWISQALEAENIQVGTRTRLAGALRNYRNILISDFENEMAIEYRPTMAFSDPFRT